MAWSPLRVRLALTTAVLSSLMLVVVGLMLERVLAANLLRDVDGRLATQARQLGELIVEATRDDGMPGGAVAALAESCRGAGHRGAAHHAGWTRPDPGAGPFRGVIS